MWIIEQPRARTTALEAQTADDPLKLVRKPFYREIEQGKLRASRFGASLRINPMDAIVWYERA
jgi:hypothetical protein